MSTHAVKIDVVATGATANAYTTIVGLKMGATSGHHATLRRLVVGGGGGVAEALLVSVRIKLATIATAGTSTSVNVNTIGVLQKGVAASKVAAIGHTYAAEPTVVGTGTYGGGEVHSASGPLILDWAKGEGPSWGESQNLLIQAASGANDAVSLGVSLEWDE